MKITVISNTTGKSVKIDTAKEKRNKKSLKKFDKYFNKAQGSYIK